ncbi:hypothetical protein [Paraconexibacter algicola]|uniref:hypothetical protein n=1 Tax=Paraconexibacter algicola TaxID=2133960 RepID=UPI001304C2B2|nr:hypothetical protein [Paraconexibacter algicola]
MTSSSHANAISRLQLLAITEQQDRSPYAPKIRRYRLAKLASTRPAGDTRQGADRREH